MNKINPIKYSSNDNYGIDKASRKKVLFVINTLGHAGAETALIELLKQFDCNKYEVSLYVLLNQGELINRLPKNVTILNMGYAPISVFDSYGRQKLYLKVTRLFFENLNGLRLLPYLTSNFIDMLCHNRLNLKNLVWRLVSDGSMKLKDNYDLAIAFLEGGATYYVADHIQAKKKAAFIHTQYDSAGYSRKLDMNCYNDYDKIFAISEQVKNHFIKVYPEYINKTYAFNNIINCDYIRNRACEKITPYKSAKGIRLLTVARLVSSKAYEYSIIAMKILKQRGIEATWYVIGEGPKRKKLEKLIQHLDLSDNYILLGSVDNPFPYFRDADIYVHASRYEGKSIAIQEAQVLAKPIIATDMSKTGEQVIDGVNGIVCSLNPVSIADSIVYMVEHPELIKKLVNNLHQMKFNYIEDIYRIYNMME